MKNIVISRDKFELVQAPLSSPRILIGRSPTCDIVLRAPEVKAVHFLLEWIGEGDFNPEQNHWILSDISEISHESDPTVISTESLLINDEQHALQGGFVFKIESNKLAESVIAGGRIQEEVSKFRFIKGTQNKDKIAEIVWIKKDSGAVEEIVHIPVRSVRFQRLVFHRFPGLVLQRVKNSEEGDRFKVLIDELPGASFFSRGTKIAQKSIDVSESDFFHVNWQNEKVFIRYVNEIPALSIPHFFFNSLLFRIGMAMSLLCFSCFLISFPHDTVITEEKPEAPRIVRIEIKEIPKVKALKLAHESEPPKKVKAEPSPTLRKVSKLEKPAKSGKVAVKKNISSSHLGLNSLSSPNAQQVGLLGLFANNKAPKNAEIHADSIINNSSRENTLTENQKNAVLLVKNPLTELVKQVQQNADDENTPKKDNLKLAASPVLNSASKLKPTSLASAARTSEESTWKGVGKEYNAFDVGELNILGGLDRETVRRIIAGYRGKIRVCYEKALLGNSVVAGRVNYQWEISPIGPVSETKITKSTINSQNLEECVKGVIQSMVFPKASNERPTTVIYPFEFHPKS